MQSLKQIKRRIESVREVLKVTHAMKIVASVKLRRAKEKISQSRPYGRHMHLMCRRMQNRYCFDDIPTPLLTGNGQDRSHLFVVYATDRGLCGGLNSTLVKLVSDRIERRLAYGNEVKLLCVGKKAHTLLKAKYKDRIHDVLEPIDGLEASFHDIEDIYRIIFDLFDTGHVGTVCQFYSKFETVAKQSPKGQQLIPVRFASLVKNDRVETPHVGHAVCTFEPSAAEVFRDLLPHYIRSQIFRAVLENAASEQGARMLAMDRASRNASELIDAQTLQYNKLRQQRITNELNEIVAAIR